MEEVSDDLFSGQTATSMDFQFFSYVTLTTLGYGNLVPEGDLGMTLASLEAIIGQVFLVTVVALAVGNLGAEAPPAGPAGRRTDPARRRSGDPR